MDCLAAINAINRANDHSDHESLFADDACTSGVMKADHLLSPAENQGEVKHVTQNI